MKATFANALPRLLSSSTVNLGLSSGRLNLWAEVSTLAIALRQDAEGGLLRRAATPLTWEDDGLLVTLTIAGDANKVATVLQQLPNVIDPMQRHRSGSSRSRT